MAATVTLESVVKWAQTFTKLVPIIGVGGYNNEPALSICNNVLQEMLSPPYNWKFNSIDAAPFTTDTTLNTQDYQTNITDMNWLESCSVEQTASTQQPKPIGPLLVVKNLAPTADVSNPDKICMIRESNSGCWFRLSPVPSMNQQWTIYPTYQGKAPLKMGLSETWSPIPDELGFVYRQGFLAMAYKHADDPRWEKDYALFQAMMQKALGMKDAENPDEGFYPVTPLMIG